MQLLFLLAVSLLVAILARRVHLPYTVGLVLVGAGAAVVHVDFGAALSHDFIYYVILPPLLFEAALALRWGDIQRDALLLLVLAVLGTILAAGVVAYGAHLLMAWPLEIALVFGALIAATDPVAVIAMFKDNRVGGRLRMLLETESLFNDAAAAVLFAVAVGFATTSGGMDVRAISMTVASTVLGGIFVGAAAGLAAIVLASRSSEHVVEVALTVLCAYGAFLVAEHFHVSGVLAAVVAGLIVGNLGVLSERSEISTQAKAFAVEFWEFAAFIANSVVFPLIGVAIASARYPVTLAPALCGLVVLVLLARAVTVYPLSGLFNWSRQRVPMAHQHVLWWGGLRGALALALAFSLPTTLPHRDEIVVATFVVVAFSIVVQGLTMPVLLRRLRLAA